MAFAKSLSLRHDASTALAVGSLVKRGASSSRLDPDFAGSCCMVKCLQCAVACSGMCFVLEPRALSMQMWLGAGSLELTSAPWLEKQRFKALEADTDAACVSQPNLLEALQHVKPSAPVTPAQARMYAAFKQGSH